VLVAIELDHQLRGVAIEVSNISIHRDLPPEFRAVKTRAAQLRPKDLFAFCRLFAQRARECQAA
jgi:hypothetical protein